MSNFLTALIIGCSAAIIDVIPMVIQRLNKYACFSAAAQWIVLGFIIPYVQWDMQPWLKGLLIGEMAALPILILVFEKEPKSVIPILVFSALLGAGVGWAGASFIVF